MSLLLLLLSYSITKLGSNNIFFSFFALYFWTLFCLRDHSENKAFCLFCVISAKKTRYTFIISKCYALFLFCGVFFCFFFFSNFNTDIFNVSIIFITLLLYSFCLFWQNKTYLITSVYKKLNQVKNIYPHFWFIKIKNK